VKPVKLQFIVEGMFMIPLTHHTTAVYLTVSISTSVAVASS